MTCTEQIVDFNHQLLIVDDDNTHRCAAAFMCDIGLMKTCLTVALPLTEHVQKLSLDYSMWFHRKFKVFNAIFYFTD